MSNLTITATNTTGSKITFRDLDGFSLNTGASYDISDLFNPIELSESTILYTNVSSGDVTLNGLSTADALKCLHVLTEYEAEQSGGGGVNDIHLILGGRGESLNWWQFESLTFFAGRYFLFRGTDILGTPTSVKIFGAATTTDGQVGTIQIYDETNDNVIAEVLMSGTTNVLYTDSTLQNLPTGESMFQLRAKTDQDNKRLMIHYAGVIF